MSFNKTLPISFGMGATRCVLLLPGVVVKVPYLFKWRNFLHGLLANMQERQFSATGWAELCPVLFADPLGFVVVMRRACPLSEEDWAGFGYKGFVEKDGYSVPAENKRSSFGWLDGRIVAVDYGT